ncbi:MAG: UPF0280 family protein [Pseudomonadota bacterium]
MIPPAARLLNGRLHLQHGPIDLILDASGPGRAEALARATARFQTILTDLVAILPDLRRPVGPNTRALLSQYACHTVAARMLTAVLPHRSQYVTPMAAVAGAVADEVLETLARSPGIAKAWVNNGGDLALHLTGAEVFRTALAAAPGMVLEIPARSPIRGIATSGWRGRSHSLGIADAVTALASTAAAADVAATLIANAVDLPGHPAIIRAAARTLAPDSDLGPRLVTTHVGPLTKSEALQALEKGALFAEGLKTRGLIHAAHLTLNATYRQTGDLTLAEPAHA